jgi:hypothetical protein
MNSTTFVFWAESQRLDLCHSIEYYRHYLSGFTPLDRHQHLKYLLVLREYFVQHLSPDRWSTNKVEIDELQKVALSCGSFEELAELHVLLIDLGIDPISPRGW